MSKLISTGFRLVFRLSADTFRDLVAERYGANEDLDTAWLSFEPVARTLVDAFYMTLDDPDFETLVPKLETIDAELRGIAYEGVGMALTLLDSLFPWKRLTAFVDGPGADYAILLYIGAGLVLPRVPISPERFLPKNDPVLQWFVMDGYGFYDGFFNWRRTITDRGVPKRLHGYSRPAFDQGLGRSFWFSTGANVERIEETISDFPADRQADLWSGIGLACAYAAGVVDRDTIESLLEVAGDHRADIAVGTAMAAVVREETSHPAPHTDLACDVVWNRTSPEVADIAAFNRQGLPPDGEQPAYDVWRSRLRASWTADQTSAQSADPAERSRS